MRVERQTVGAMSSLFMAFELKKMGDIVKEHVGNLGVLRVIWEVVIRLRIGSYEFDMFNNIGVANI